MTHKESSPIRQNEDSPLMGASRTDPKLNRRLERERRELVRDGRLLIGALTVPEQLVGVKPTDKTK